MTQLERIKRAVRAYIVPLNREESRFAVYVQAACDSDEWMRSSFDGGASLPKNGGTICNQPRATPPPLEVLWPSCEDGSPAEERRVRLQYQVFSRRGGWPAYHFYLQGGGYRKADALARSLKDLNPGLECLVLSGWAPAIP